MSARNLSKNKALPARGRSRRADAPPRASANGGFGDYADPGRQSGFEGAQSSHVRSAFLQFPINSWREMNRLTRVELLRKIRALDANLGLISRIKQTIRRRSVGSGIELIPTTFDVDWNNENRKRFENWASFPAGYSIDASRDLWEDQAIAAESVPGDGEFFEALVNGPGGTPMVQPLDPFEIDSRGAPDWDDGIWTDDFLRPGFYAVRELPKLSQIVNTQLGFRSVPADSMIHLFQRRRAKQGRGITWFYSGINQGIDALDLGALITGTAKLHSGLAVTVKKAGKLNKKGAFDKIRGLATGNGADDHTDVRALERIYGGGMISYLGAEGEVDLKSSAFPQTNLLLFRKLLMFDIAAGLGVPLQAVYDMEEMGGAGLRAALDDAQQFFDAIQDLVFYRHTRRIYIWNTARAIKSGAIRPCKDPQWWLCKGHGPARITPDNGRTAQAQVMLLKNGALSRVRLFAERGQDAYEELAEEIRLQKWLKIECAAADIDTSTIIEPTPGAASQDSTADDTEDPQDDPSPKPKPGTAD